ncbi:MAG TPA: H(+)/Cl(-) exchange transporter ClcA [Steroidobacteraceae bacterium]|nr:H(+)/Cl(-) exchange transporter ClcA [Steroidobacteraceae bacterium]
MSSNQRGPVLALAVLSLAAGAATGLLAAVFRLALSRADRLRDSLLAWLHAYGAFGLLAAAVICALAAAVAAWLVRRFSPHATGSGIPHVEAQLSGSWSGSPLRIMFVKFFGGLLAIGGGLALGREGPTVQMGATLSLLFGKLTRRGDGDCKALLAAGAGAGLATAFNAPIAGAVFVLEELVRRFDLPITIAALGASAGAIGVARFIVGQDPDFLVAPLPYPGLWTLPVHVALGLAVGLVGILYNRAILGALRASARLTRVAPEYRAAAIGAAVGVLGWFAPQLIGGGDGITQRVLGGTVSALTAGFVLVLVVRFALGAVSYSARTPGGLFAPMLVIGAQSGLLFGELCERWLPGIGAQPVEYAVVGMAALFTAAVRAPLTGIILAIELTGSFRLLLPMLSACFAAMLVATFLDEPPIYESLRWDSKS